MILKSYLSIVCRYSSGIEIKKEQEGTGKPEERKGMKKKILKTKGKKRT